MQARQYSPVSSPTCFDDIAQATSGVGTEARRPWQSARRLRKPAWRPRLDAPLSALVRAWHAIKGAWLARRLEGVETELLALTARHAAEGRAMISREDMAIYESCCMERAILRAQIDHCRALG